MLSYTCNTSKLTAVPIITYNLNVDFARNDPFLRYGHMDSRCILRIYAVNATGGRLRWDIRARLKSHHKLLTNEVEVRIFAGIHRISMHNYGIVYTMIYSLQSAPQLVYYPVYGLQCVPKLAKDRRFTFYAKPSF